MKKILFISFLFFMILTLKSQENTFFNHNYPLEWQYDSNNLLEINGDFYLAGNIARGSETCEYWLFGYHVSKINQNGIKDTTVFFDKCEQTTYIGWKGSMLYKEDTLIVTGQIYDEFGLSKVYLLGMSLEFDTIFNYYFLNDTLVKRGFSGTIDWDNNIVLCGSFDSTYNELSGFPDTVFSKSFLLKSTLAGEILWQKSYSFEDETDGCWSALDKIIPTYDKGYIATGIFFLNHTTKNIIMKIDSLGNKEWVRILGPSNYDNPSFKDIIETKDSCYIVCGAYAYGESYGGYYPYDAYILKYDIEGNLIWSKKHRDSITSGNSSNEYYGYYSGIAENDNGNLFTILQTRSDEYGQFIGVKFRIRCLDSYGNRKWDKVIDSVGNQLGALFPHSIVLTTDEYIVVGGWGEIYYMDSTEDWTSAQRIFLLKTDTSHIDTSTNNIIQYNPTPITNFALTCYPNPASNETYIEIPKEIKEDILIVYSTNGQIVLEQNIIYGENKINLYDFKPGMYLLRLKNNNLYGKLLVK
ncbi:MAG: T9SS type A sorting domain-containing protein [Bacteroidales bacterium]|nr:T9SS type A sorting domain-containing protein [Bacteroidales bacterium]